MKNPSVYANDLAIRPAGCVSFLHLSDGEQGHVFNLQAVCLKLTWVDFRLKDYTPISGAVLGLAGW